MAIEEGTATQLTIENYWLSLENERLKAAIEFLVTHYNPNPCLFDPASPDGREWVKVLDEMDRRNADSHDPRLGI